MTEPARFAAAELLAFTTEAFCRAGVARERAALIADAFVQTDLLGFHSHGLVRVPQNLRWIARGETRITGEPRVIGGRGAVINADAAYLAGALTLDWAIRHGVEQARAHGIAILTIRRSQHIGALAPFLLRIAEQGYPAFAMVSTPEESLVTVDGAKSPLFSTNPFGFAFPTDGTPLLLDMSLAVTAAGKVRTAAREGRALRGDWIIDAAGQPTNDPRALDTGALLPIGGTDHGHKGSGLLLWSELFSSALGGWGRLDRTGEDDANSIYLAIHEPDAFGGVQTIRRQASHLARLYAELRPRGPGAAPRVPGHEALARRTRGLKHGLALPQAVVEALRRVAAAQGLSAPRASSGPSRANSG